jgi:large subunit ribosomal protein L22
MEVQSLYKYARISAMKARDVAREIQGMPVSNALSVLHYTPKKAALLFGKTLQSAVANAEHNHSMDADDLFVKSATATDGPSLKRIMPRARGSASPIKKRMCHIKVVVASITATAAAKAEADAKKAAKKGTPVVAAAPAAKAKRPRKEAVAAE